MERNVIMVQFRAAKIINARCQTGRSKRHFGLFHVCYRIVPCRMCASAQPIPAAHLYGADAAATPSHPYRKDLRIRLVLSRKVLTTTSDASVYGAMVRLAQDFSLRYPLVDGQNLGSVDGDPILTVIPEGPPLAC